MVSDWAGIILRTIWFKSLCCVCHTVLLPYETFPNALSGIIILRAVYSLERLNNILSLLSLHLFFFLPLNEYVRILIILIYICIINVSTLYRFSLWHRSYCFWPQAWLSQSSTCSLNVYVRDCVKEGAARKKYHNLFSK